MSKTSMRLTVSIGIVFLITVGFLLTLLPSNNIADAQSTCTEGGFFVLQSSKQCVRTSNVRYPWQCQSISPTTIEYSCYWNLNSDSCATDPTPWYSGCDIPIDQLSGFQVGTCDEIVGDYVSGACYLDSSGGGGTTPPPPSSTQTCEEYSSYAQLNRYPQYNPNRTAVREMQSSLIYLGYSVGSAGADGYYGANTASAISQFKSANGLSGGGDYFETSAWQVLENKVNEKVGTCGTTTTTTTTTATYALQMRSSIITSSGEISIRGINLTTCLGNGTTNFSKTSTSSRPACSIGAPATTTIIANGEEYVFVEWLKNGLTQSSDRNSSIDVTNSNSPAVAIAYYELSEPDCVGAGCSCGTNDDCDTGLICTNGTCEPTQPPSQCTDGADNDGDGLIDASDPGCDGTGGGGGGNGCVGYECDDSEGDENEDAPQVWISITPKIVGRGGSATLTWGIYNPGDFELAGCTASSNPNDISWSGGVGGQGTAAVTPDQIGQVTYTITCTNTEDESGSAQATVLVPFIDEVRP